MRVRDTLMQSGITLFAAFCQLNDITPPTIVSYTRDKFPMRSATCAYYRPTSIHISPDMCATPGYAGRAWSWPGYVIDRTPHGVVQHELGHHVDYMLGTVRGAYWSDYSQRLRAATGEDKVTNYCPNDAEWFAEIFRVFVTNPDLLRLMRPKTFMAIREKLMPVITDPWDHVLRDAPTRTIEQARKKIQSAHGALL